MKYLDFLVEKMVLFYVQIDFSAGNGWTGKHRSEDWCRREPTQRPSLHETNWMPMTIRNSITWKLADAPCASALQGDSNPWWWNHGTDSIRIAVHTALRGTYSKNMKIHLAEFGRPSRMLARSNKIWIYWNPFIKTDERAGVLCNIGRALRDFFSPYHSKKNGDGEIIKVSLGESGRPWNPWFIYENQFKDRDSLQHRASPSRIFLALPFKEKWWWWDNQNIRLCVIEV